MSYSSETQKQVKIKNDDPIRMKLSGGRWWIVAIMSACIAYNIGDVEAELRRGNKLKEDEIKIRKEQLDLARRRFQLDSIAFEENHKIR